MRASRTYGVVRGALSNGRSYREHHSRECSECPPAEVKTHRMEVMIKPRPAATSQRKAPILVFFWAAAGNAVVRAKASTIIEARIFMKFSHHPN
jgi:hypothetical protein